MTASYALMDTETFNVVGSYRSQAAALRVVAEAAQQYGKDSAEARSLVLYRQDGPSAESFIAQGEELVSRALATTANGHATHRRDGSNGRNGSIASHGAATPKPTAAGRTRRSS